ncbi:MAG: bifunctional folylpolyglutamate synthase/dihydrofolate synthase [Candidatus Phytoplasma sp.]|nr:bifunctional folylpolyglutamate synthase/dihydrofolate synthase [Phytoplasma sp.]
MFKSLSQAIDWIEKQPRFKDKVDLNHLKKAYQNLNIDLSNIKKIHVAGTNGKGSTSAYLSYIGIASNYKVGSFTSPYLVSFNERIRINMIPINDLELLQLINEFYVFNESLFEKLSFFEIMTLMSFKYFSDQKVDLMIIEVGIGGLLDATNILDYDLSLITNVGMDHMKQLGNTLESIALNKLGIVKPYHKLLTTMDEKLLPLAMKVCEEKKAECIPLNETMVQTVNDYPHQITIDDNLFSILLGEHQNLNALLAYKAFLSLYPDTDIKNIEKGFKSTKWAGRLEEIIPNVFIDGAHNMHAIDQLIQSSARMFKGQKIGILFSALGDKEIDEMLLRLKTISSEIIVTSFNDFRYKDLSYVNNKGFSFESDYHKAYLKLKEKNCDIILITGSIHFIGEIKKNLLGVLND